VKLTVFVVGYLLTLSKEKKASNRQVVNKNLYIAGWILFITMQ
jgi:uncharacterized membrane protein